jgi:hypothetical protein
MLLIKIILQRDYLNHVEVNDLIITHVFQTLHSWIKNAIKIQKHGSTFHAYRQCKTISHILPKTLILKVSEFILRLIKTEMTGTIWSVEM